MCSSLYYVGGVCIAMFACRLLYWLYATFIRPIDLSQYKSADSWALITGCTDGIGFGFAEILASKGFNLILVSRNQEKLDKVKARLQELDKKIKIETIANEASDTNLHNLQLIANHVKDKRLSLLINNVGISQEAKGRLDRLDPSKIEQVIKVNCVYPSMLTNLLLPALLKTANPNGHRSLIINVASLAGLMSVPFSSIYASTKAYNRIFSNSLAAEYYSSGIDVLCVNPGFVASNMTKMKTSLVCCSARECAEASLRKIGLVDIIPHWKHAIIFGLFNIVHSTLPLWIQVYFTGRVIKLVMTRVGMKREKAA